MAPKRVITRKSAPLLSGLKKRKGKHQVSEASQETPQEEAVQIASIDQNSPEKNQEKAASGSNLPERGTDSYQQSLSNQQRLWAKLADEINTFLTIDNSLCGESMGHYLFRSVEKLLVDHYPMMKDVGLLQLRDLCNQMLAKVGRASLSEFLDPWNKSPKYPILSGFLYPEEQYAQKKTVESQDKEDFLKRKEEHRLVQWQRSKVAMGLPPKKVDVGPGEQSSEMNPHPKAKQEYLSKKEQKALKIQEKEAKKKSEVVVLSDSESLNLKQEAPRIRIEDLPILGDLEQDASASVEERRLGIPPHFAMMGRDLAQMLADGEGEEPEVEVSEYQASEREDSAAWELRMAREDVDETLRMNDARFLEIITYDRAQIFDFVRDEHHYQVLRAFANSWSLHFISIRNNSSLAAWRFLSHHLRKQCRATRNAVKMSLEHAGGVVSDVIMKVMEPERMTLLERMITAYPAAQLKLIMLRSTRAFAEALEAHYEDLYRFHPNRNGLVGMNFILTLQEYLMAAQEGRRPGPTPDIEAGHRHDEQMTAIFHLRTGLLTIENIGL